MNEVILKDISISHAMKILRRYNSHEKRKLIKISSVNLEEQEPQYKTKITDKSSIPQKISYEDVTKFSLNIQYTGTSNV